MTEQQNHNVSVRLNKEDYKKLQYLHEKYNKVSYGKVSLADVLRESIKELYLIEIEKETKTKEKEKAVTIVLENEKATHTDKIEK